MSRTITFANLKGGTGKTTLCINIAAHLAQRNDANRVLVVDFDPQANATSGLGIDASTLQYSILDAVLERCTGYSGVPMNRIILGTDIENLHLAPSELNFGTAPMMMQETKNRVGLLSKILETVKSYYDYILIDVPSDTGLFMLNGLHAAEQVVIPLDPSIFALEALENLKSYCTDIEDQTGHIIHQLTLVLNRYKARSPSKRTKTLTASEEVESAMKDMSLPLCTVPDSAAVYRAQQKGIPVCQHAPKTKVNTAFNAIANYLALSA